MGVARRNGRPQRAWNEAQTTALLQQLLPLLSLILLLLLESSEALVPRVIDVPPGAGVLTDDGGDPDAFEVHTVERGETVWRLQVPGASAVGVRFDPVELDPLLVELELHGSSCGEAAPGLRIRPEEARGHTLVVPGEVAEIHLYAQVAASGGFVAEYFGLDLPGLSPCGAVAQLVPASDGRIDHAEFIEAEAYETYADTYAEDARLEARWLVVAEPGEGIALELDGLDADDELVVDVWDASSSTLCRRSTASFEEDPRPERELRIGGNYALVEAQGALASGGFGVAIRTYPLLDPAALDPNCLAGEHVRLEGPTGFISYPGSNRNQYANLASHMWTIEAPTGMGVQLRFSDFALEGRRDVLQVAEVASGAICREFSGRHGLGEAVGTARGALSIQFLANSRTRRRGFNFTYEVLPVDAVLDNCHDKSEILGPLAATFTNDDLRLRKRPHRAFVEKRWLIRVDPGQGVRLVFDALELNTGATVRVQDPSTGRHCRTLPSTDIAPADVRVAGNELVVSMRTRASSEDAPGFRASFEPLSAGELAALGGPNCVDLAPTQLGPAAGRISLDGLVDNNARVWRIEVPPGQGIRLRFGAFRLGSPKEGQLLVTDLVSGNTCRRYHGTNGAGKEIVMAGNLVELKLEKQLVFGTDRFAVDYEPVPGAAAQAADNCLDQDVLVVGPGSGTILGRGLPFLDQSWLIRVDPGFGIQLNLRTFSSSVQSGAAQAAISVSEPASRRVCKAFNSSSQAILTQGDREVVTASNELVLRFQIDGDALSEDIAFQATYTPIPPSATLGATCDGGVQVLGQESTVLSVQGPSPDLDRTWILLAAAGRGVELRIDSFDAPSPAFLQVRDAVDNRTCATIAAGAPPGIVLAAAERVAVRLVSPALAAGAGLSASFREVDLAEGVCELWDPASEVPSGDGGVLVSEGPGHAEPSAANKRGLHQALIFVLALLAPAAALL